MIKDTRFWSKFYCSNCHKSFRVKLQPLKKRNGVIIISEGLPFELHVHCPYCESYIPQTKDISKKGEKIMRKLK